MWTISYVLNLKPTIAYALTVYFWLLLFSLGTFLLVKKLSKNNLLAITYSLLVMLGPIGFSSIAQSQGFIEPHRYTPIIFYFFF